MDSIRANAATGVVLAGVVVAAVVVSAPPAEAATTRSVAMTGALTFSPARVIVAKGTVVRWHNTAGFTHTTTRTGLWNATVAPGGSFSRAFRKAGTFGYVCTIHRGMTGTVVVK